MQRLHRESDIKRVFREGCRFHSPVAVLHARRRSGEQRTLPGPRLTVIAGRSFPTAVARSRARRILREVSRILLKDTRDPCDLLVVASPEALAQPYQARLQTLADLFRRAKLLPEKAVTPR